MLELFVYGTLMRGEENHGALGGAPLLARVATAPRYALVDLGPYPALVAGGATTVQGELYAVDEALLGALDELEGHPELYRRDRVVLEDGRVALAYLFARDHAGLPLLAGDWKLRR
jgi:gamma-glutamylaminecyclotransferase